MNEITRQFRDFFVSLKLTVVLLALGIGLVFWATLDQTNLGVWGVQHKFFHSLFVMVNVPGTQFPIPVYPGGYLIGGFLLVNLVAAHLYRFKLSWKKAGIWVTHLGLILLLVGELISGLLQRDYEMAINEGQTKNYSVSERYAELAITDTTDPKTDEVTAIPSELLEKGDVIQTPALPFRIVPKAYYANSDLFMKDQVPNAPPTMANQGDLRMVMQPRALTYKEDERNFPAGYVELDGPAGPLGVFMVSTLYATPSLESLPQYFDYMGHTYKIAMRFARLYHPFTLSLEKFTHEIYPGTDIPKNFSSEVKLKSDDGKVDREVRIYMNNPLRYGGYTFYQQKFEPNNEHVTILQVVKNPSWLVPYIACVMMAGGMAFHFLLHLAGFASRQRRDTATA